MKTVQRSRIRIKKTTGKTVRSLLTMHQPKKTSTKKINMIGNSSGKKINFRYGRMPSSVRNNSVLVISGLAVFLIVGLVLTAVWRYWGAEFSAMMGLVLGLGFALFFSWRMQSDALRVLGRERKQFLSDYERLVRETARNRQDVSALKKDLIETGLAAQRMQTMQGMGAGQDIGRRMLDTLVGKLSSLGSKAIENEEENISASDSSLLRMKKAIFKSDNDVSSYDSRFEDWTDTEILGHVSKAIKQDSIDLFIQPIVNLPQRKRRFYEMYSRILVAPDVYLPADRYIHLAGQNNMLAELDNLLLLRGLQLIQAADAGNLNRSFFCNISPLTLNDKKFMGDLLEFVTQYRILAPRLIFELGQQDIRTMDTSVLKILDGLSILGCRFSMDRVVDLDFDFDRLSACHIRFVKVSGRILGRKMDKKGGFTQLRRLKDDLDYNGVDLIVEKIETEEQVLKLLDMEIDYGQGYLFGEPRKWTEKSSQ